MRLAGAKQAAEKSMFSDELPQEHSSEAKVQFHFQLFTARDPDPEECRGHALKRNRVAIGLDFE